MKILQDIYKITNENGVFEGKNLYKVLLESKSEFSKEYKIYKNNILFDSIKRNLDNQGNIIR